MRIEIDSTKNATKKEVAPLRKTLRMSGSGYEQVRLPIGQYAFLTVTNATVNTISVYEGRTTSTASSANKLLQKITPQTSLTVPIPDIGELTLVWQDGGGSGPKEAQLVYTQENMGINTVLGSSANQNVSLVSDSIGLLKDSQLPEDLTANGNLSVSIEEEKPITGAKHTTVGDNTVKATAGKVYGVIAVGGNVEIKDDTTPIAYCAAGQSVMFPRPIACAVSIIANLSGAGSAYVLYE